MWLINNLKVRQQRGFATLMLTFMVLLSVTAIAFFNAESVVTQSQVATNSFQAKQAFDAAQAGLDYGVAYLTKNRSTITNGTVITGTLSNGSSYSSTFTFQDGVDKVKIRATGTSADGQTTKITTQQVKYIAPGTSAITATRPATATYRVLMGGSSMITNLSSPYTILTGNSVGFSSSLAATYTSDGLSSKAGKAGPDIKTYDSTLGNMYLGQYTANLAFETYALGSTINAVIGAVNLTGSKSATLGNNGSVSSLISQNPAYKTFNITISSTATAPVITLGTGNFGSANNPINIYVTSATPSMINITGPGTFYGNIYSNTQVRVSGTGNVIGNIFATQNVGVRDAGHVTGTLATSRELNMDTTGKIDGYVVAGLNANLINASSINGSIIVNGTLTLSNTSRIQYDATKATFTNPTSSSSSSDSSSSDSSSSTGGYGIVAGSWSDL